MTSGNEGYVPALRFNWLTPFYDSLLRATLKEDKFKRMLVEQLQLRPGQRVLDVGCGTATLTLMIKQACPEAEVIGLDGDPKVLRIAREKAAAAGLVIGLVEAMSYDPPFPAGSFDRVVSSLVFHHLSAQNKRRTLVRVHELLRRGGELYLADWGKARNLLMRAAFLSVQLFDGIANTSDNVRGLLVPMMQESGFRDVEETHREMTVFGTLSLYRARRSGDA